MHIFVNRQYLIVFQRGHASIHSQQTFFFFVFYTTHSGESEMHFCIYQLGVYKRVIVSVTLVVGLDWGTHTLSLPPSFLAPQAVTTLSSLTFYVSVSYVFCMLEVYPHLRVND